MSHEFGCCSLCLESASLRLIPRVNGLTSTSGTCTYSLPFPYAFQRSSSLTSRSPPKGFNCENAQYSGRPINRLVALGGALSGISEDVNVESGQSLGGAKVLLRSCAIQ
jgi:hypothetical protein